MGAVDRVERLSCYAALQVAPQTMAGNNSVAESPDRRPNARVRPSLRAQARMQRFDTIVLGLGAMGSAALYHLARKGSRVLGLDRYSPPHAFGSTHGDTRITRLAIGEGAHYTPLAIRSHTLWRLLERESGATLSPCQPRPGRSG